MAGASASEVGNAQKQSLYASYVQETSEKTTYPNILEDSAPTQKKADVFYLKKLKKQEKVFKKTKPKQGKNAILTKNISKSDTRKTASKSSVYSKNIPENKSENIKATCDKSTYSKNFSKKFNSSMTNQGNIQAKNQLIIGTIENSSDKFPVNHDPLKPELSNESEYLSPENNNLYGKPVALNNEPVAAAGETKYLVKSSNCDINAPTVKSLAAALTNGKTSTMSKAVAIFNYVRDKISYSFYYNTKKGAVGTLTSKSGNCVDQTHLLIALMRSVGIPARYVHVKARFTSGKVYGHIYAHVFVNGKWYAADTTSTKNTFGVIKNWNTQTRTFYGTYASLPF